MPHDNWFTAGSDIEVAAWQAILRWNAGSRVGSLDAAALRRERSLVADRDPAHWHHFFGGLGLHELLDHRLLDFFQYGWSDMTPGNLAQCNDGGFVVFHIDQRIGTVCDPSRALRSNEHHFKYVVDIIETIFDRNSGHFCYYSNE